MTERNVKKVLGVKLTEEGLIEVRIEATKRRRIWLKRIGANVEASCDSSICPLYYLCPTLKSPLVKFPTFGVFCNKLFREYPDLAFQLATKFGITHINQVVPIKKRQP